MTNFFERQEGARRRTAQLVAIYGLTVILLVVGLYVSAVVLLEGTVVVRPWILAAVSTAILLGLWGARTIRLSELGQGGHVVAELLNGQPLTPSQATSEGQQLLNVVEEMAIAAGTPAPKVYVLPEQGINAFSAGFTQDDAVIGVTQGALQHLDRDEMQAVVAHEFSHILNGDTALNLRLMCWTHGIEALRDLLASVLLAFVPVGLVRTVGAGATWAAGQIRDIASRGATGVLILLGLLVAGFFFGPMIFGPLFLFLGAIVALFQHPVVRYSALIVATGAALGGLGALGAQLIRARVSREREFLADAAATQFTRNPEALARALRKQRDCEHGGRVRAGGVGAMQHLFFGRAVALDDLLADWLPTPRWLSTHPSVEERIRRIDSSLLDDAAPADRSAEAEGAAETDEDPGGGDGPVSPEALLERAGTLGPDQLAEAEALHAALPSALLNASHEPLGALALTYALLMDAEAERREEQRNVLWERETSSVYHETKRLVDSTETLDRALHLPLVEVAAPSLRDLSPDQRERCRRTIRALAEADDRVTMFEFALETVVRHSLDSAEGSNETSAPSTLSAVRAETVALLSALARAGHDSEAAVQRAFEAGDRPLAESHDLKPAERTAADPSALHEALDRLARTALDLRKEVLQACARCAAADDRIERSEEELLRAVAVALGVPLPAGWAGEGLSEGAEGDAAEPKSLEGA